MATSIHIQTLLKTGGFTVADSVIKPRLVAAVAAREKQGKSRFMLTAPSPIAVFDSDYGLEGVVHNFLPEKQILVYRVPMPDPYTKTAMDDAYDVWCQMEKAYDQVLSNPDIATVGFDTATELWEVARLAFLGKLEQVKSHHYGMVNGVFRRFLKKALDSDKNVILVQKMKAEYINDKRTGTYEMSGFGDTPHIVQVIVNPFRVDNDGELEDGTVVKRGEFGIKIYESRHQPKYNDTYLMGPMASFPFLASLIVPNTTPDMYM